jgi:hypothetical protein
MVGGGRAAQKQVPRELQDSGERLVQTELSKLACGLPAVREHTENKVLAKTDSRCQTVKN